MTQDTQAEVTGQARPRPGAALVIAYGKFIFKYRNWLFPVVFGALFNFLPPVLAAGSLARDLWLDLFGALVVFAGQGLRAAVIGLAYIKRGGLNKQVHADSLVTDGLFAHSRNPIYVGNLLMLFGWLIIHNNPWVYLLAGGLILFSYRAIVAAEEDFLHRTFGAEYQAYCREVPRWHLKLRRLGATLTEHPFNWRRVILKDYSSIMFAVIITSGLIGYEHVTTLGFEAALPALVWIAGIWALAFLAGIVVRVLKKTKRLTEHTA